MAMSCFKVVSHYIPERMRKILINFYQDGSSVDWVQPGSLTCKTLVTPLHSQIHYYHSLWNIMSDRAGRSFPLKWCWSQKRFFSYAVTPPGHKHASPTSSVSKYWIWQLIVLPLTDHFHMDSRKIVTVEFLFTWCATCIFSPLRPPMKWLTPQEFQEWCVTNCHWFFLASLLPHNATESSSILTPQSESTNVPIYNVRQ